MSNEQTSEVPQLLGCMLQYGLVSVLSLWSRPPKKERDECHATHVNSWSKSVDWSENAPCIWLLSRGQHLDENSDNAMRHNTECFLPEEKLLTVHVLLLSSDFVPPIGQKTHLGDIIARYTHSIIPQRMVCESFEEVALLEMNMQSCEFFFPCDHLWEGWRNGVKDLFDTNSSQYHHHGTSCESRFVEVTDEIVCDDYCIVDIKSRALLQNGLSCAEVEELRVWHHALGLCKVVSQVLVAHHMSCTRKTDVKFGDEFSDVFPD